MTNPIYVLGLDGAVHEGRRVVSHVELSEWANSLEVQCCDRCKVALRTLTNKDLGYFTRWCPLCFPNHDLDAEYRDIMHRRCT